MAKASDRDCAVFCCHVLLAEARARRLRGSHSFASMLLQWAANSRLRIPKKEPAQLRLFGDAIIREAAE